jgi:transcriptional regulator with XRE-family HTH domain
MTKYSITYTPRELMEAFSERIKILRKNRKWTQEELSFRSGVALGTYRKFERTGLISLESFLLLCQALGELQQLESFLVPKINVDLKDLFDV